MPRKEYAGYPTPARELQVEVEKIHKQLGASKANWVEIAGLSTKLVELARKDVLDAQHVPTAPVAMKLALANAFLIQTAIASMISILGQELTDVHTRLTDVEKAVRTLRLAVK